MPIAEPMTMFTDYVLGVLALSFAARIAVAGRRAGSMAQLTWSAALLALSFTAFVGGTVHGFAPALSERGEAGLWQAIFLSIGVTNAALLAGEITATFAARTRRSLLVLTALMLAAYTGLVVTRGSLELVMLYSVPMTAAVLALGVFAWSRRSAPSGAWIAGGIATMALSAGVKQSGFTLGPEFDTNNVCHVIQMVGAWLLYRGGLLFPAAPAT